MAAQLGGFNEYGRIRRVALRRPEAAFQNPAKIAAEWQKLAYTEAPLLDQAAREYDRLEASLKSVGATLDHLPADPSLTIDALYVRDAAIVAPGGLILCNMGKPARQGEPALHGKALGTAGIPLLGRIEGAGRIEGGDLVWFDEHCLAVARGYRTNDEGIRQLQALVGPKVEVVTVPLPHYRGPGDVFHLMSILSPLDCDLLLVYSALMPVPFREWLLARGMTLVEVPDAEFDSMGCNVLAIAPRHCVMLEGNPQTEARLRAAGCRVEVIAGREISAKGQGGPTCLTRPLLRD
ncbi:dimethylarginine dimethylaminohydrolase family protein [Hypericibacter sp.]|uniref:dimethylarginine dimethylaminohydrolase family protein n=1 Tax=Hypericibacter sp. TaxID=2705401 RepID=UPI003D6C797F